MSNAIVSQKITSAEKNRATSLQSEEVQRMRVEWRLSPYSSSEMDEYYYLTSKITARTGCCVVYITYFTNSRHDFAYCIQGPTDVPKFCAGIHGARRVCQFIPALKQLREYLNQN